MLNADSLHSLLLLLALVAGGINVALLIAVAAGRFAAARLPAVFLALTILTAASAGVSVVIHRVAGHGRDALEPMAMAAFATHHRAYQAAVLLIIIGTAAWWHASRSDRGNESTPDG